MTTNTEKETIIKIGKIMLRYARIYAQRQHGDHNKWDYAGYVFQEGGGDLFLFHNGKYYEYDFDEDMINISILFRTFRDLTRVEGGKPWIKCKAAIRNDGELKMLFEFDDKGKWNITPSNMGSRYEILIGDIFPHK